MGARRRNRPGPRRGVSTRDRIVAAADQLFDELGIGKINVADIADYAGIHRVTVYRHFADREAILDEVLERRFQPVIDRAATRLAGATRFPDDLAYVIVAAAAETRHRPDLMRRCGSVLEQAASRAT